MASSLDKEFIERMNKLYSLDFIRKSMTERINDGKVKMAKGCQAQVQNFAAKSFGFGF